MNRDTGDDGIVLIENILFYQNWINLKNSDSFLQKAFLTVRKSKRIAE